MAEQTEQETAPAGCPHLDQIRAARLLLAGALWLGDTGGAGAEAGWCDDTSPPPNDFRLQPTGAASANSAPAWGRCTENGGPLLATYAANDQVEVSQVGRLSRGAATGMRTAVATPRTADARR